MAKLKPTKVIRRRQYIEASDVGCSFPLMAHIRMKPSVSATLMKYHGLCYKYGNKESLRFLFEKVCMPAISEYVKPYAQKASKTRQERSALRRSLI